MRNTQFLKRAAFTAGVAPFALGLAMVSAPAMAQDAQGADDGEGEVIVVTGSRIARRDLETAAPLAVVSAEEFKLSGAVNVEQVLNALPQVIPGTTSFSNNPGGGVATLDLRGLGTNRNLVLVNGRRWMFFDTAQTVDLNTIPQFLIESVDVVTGGASAVYGSDAIAGVVNFRLRNLTGIEVGTQYSVTQRGDGGRFNAHAAIGGEFADGRGKVTIFSEYFKRKSIFQGDRAFSRSTLADDGAGGFTPGGSATTPAGRFAVPASATIGPDPDGPGPLLAPTAPRGLGTNFGTALGATFDSGTGSSRPFLGSDLYNYAPANYLMVPQERWLAGGFGEYEVSDAVTAYMEVAVTNNRVANELAATPVTGAFNVNLARVAPLLSAADNAAFAQIDANETAINVARAANGLTPLFAGTAAAANAAGVIQLSAANRRVIETGSRNTLDERNAFRVLTGVRGDITDKLSYDAYYFYARTRNANVQSGNISRRAYQAGLDGTAPVIDIFGPNTLSQASVNQISILAQNNDISTLQVASASVSGGLFNLGMGGDDVGFALGAEYRKMGSRFIPDTALSSGDVIGFNAGNPTQGSYSAKEVFGEVRVPIAADVAFAHKLELNLAGRYSDYSLEAVGGVETYAIGLEWAPIKDITFRGQYQRAVRAPNVLELFGGAQQGFPTATDPCATPAALTNAALRSTCIATGAPAANIGQGVPSQLQPNTQLQSQTGGNPNLDAERSKSYTFGAVIRPSFIPGLNITVDYFNIKIGNAIATAGGGAANILNLCYNVFQDANNGFCQLITRNSASGAIDGSTNSDGSVAVIFAGAANLSSFKTKGVDLSVDYSRNLGFGIFEKESKLNLSFLGTYTKKTTFTPVNGLPDVIECAGFFGNNCGDPQGKYKWTARASWIDGPLTSSFQWEHLGKTTDDDALTDYSVETLKAYDLFNVSFSIEASDNLSLSMGINNLFDKKPQLIGDNQEQANTFPGTYDVLGRDFFVAAKLRF